MHGTCNPICASRKELCQRKPFRCGTPCKEHAYQAEPLKLQGWERGTAPSRGMRGTCYAHHIAHDSRLAYSVLLSVHQEKKLCQRKAFATYFKLPFDIASKHDILRSYIEQNINTCSTRSSVIVIFIIYLDYLPSSVRVLA